MGISREAISVEPPNSPWEELNSPENIGGYLSIYYSDDMSRLPVRAVTKPGDNKSDPNLETLTYGLFSTCGPRMRSGAVNRRSAYLFFATSRKSIRVLTGYYHLRWFTRGVFENSNDYCLAADTARFIEHPIPLADVDRRCRTNVSKWFRGMRLLSSDECKRMVRLIDAQPDVTADYLDEIDRLERFNMKHSGYRYVAWKQTDKFSWGRAEQYLIVKKSAVKTKSKVVNSTPTDSWKCTQCGRNVRNKALLKRCPNCGSLGTLRPLSDVAL
jgi:hypothetical protein